MLMHPLLGKNWHANGGRREIEIMASTGASPRFCDRGMLRMLQESNAPYFGKTLTSTMLRRNERLGIPSWFLHEYGDRIHVVLSLTGPNGNSRPVMCIVRASGTRPRVYLGQEWIDFAKENGFQMGDEVIFWLVARSHFHVLVCSQLQKATFENLSTKDDEDDETSDDAEISTPRQHPKEARVPPCQTNFNPAESLVTARCAQLQKPYSQRMKSNLCKQDYFKYPGLSSAVSSNSRFPQFVKKLTRNNLNGKRLPLELPWAFVKEHGDKFQAHVALLGASGNLRVVNLRIASFSGTDRVHLGKGWIEFTLENGFREGDALLFSLVGLSKFVVQLFPQAGK